MDQEATNQFFDFTYGRFTFKQIPQLMAMDSFRCHISDETKEYLRSKKVTSAIIPGIMYYLWALLSQKLDSYIVMIFYPSCLCMHNIKIIVLSWLSEYD